MLDPYRQQIKEYLQLLIPFRRIHTSINPQLEKPIAYNAYRYFVRQDTELLRSAQYYREVLGFQVREIGDAGWRLFEKDNCVIRAGHCPAAMPPRELGDQACFAYRRVDGLDDYFAQVQAQGGRILKQPTDEPWGMYEFALEENTRQS